MKLIYFGKWARGVACLEALLRSHHKVLAVVTQREIEEPSLEKFAREQGLPVLCPRDPNAPEFIRSLRSFDADLFVLAGYTKILKKDLLSVSKGGCLNLHGGRLPDYRGASPLNWQIIRGEKEIGVSIFYLDEGIDTGDVVAEARFPVSEEGTITEVLEKTLKVFPTLLLKALEDIEKGAVLRKKQDPRQGRTYPKRRPEDGLIRWNEMTAREVTNLVRALTPPYPGAFAVLGGKKCVIHKVEVLEKDLEAVPGEIRCLTEGLAVRCKEKSVLIKSVLMDGKAVAPESILVAKGKILS